MYVCLCNGVTDKDIRRHVADGACCLEDLACAAGVGAGCGRCRDTAAQVLAEATAFEGLRFHSATSPAS
jgi:bacterioferritin-associated ferredoxin